MTRVHAAFVALSAAALVACSSAQRGPYFGDERFLTFGVDPESEARRVIADLDQSGHPLSARASGRYFVALGFDLGGSPALVRIVTARGIALSLDAEPSDALRRGVRYALLLPPSERASDADGDGNEEAFVAVSPYDGGEPCLAVYGVTPSGSVSRVLTNVGAAVPAEAEWSRMLPCETPAAETATDAGTVDMDAEGAGADAEGELLRAREPDTAPPSRAQPESEPDPAGDSAPAKAEAPGSSPAP